MRDQAWRTNTNGTWEATCLIWIYLHMFYRGISYGGYAVGNMTFNDICMINETERRF